MPSNTKILDRASISNAENIGGLTKKDLIKNKAGRLFQEKVLNGKEEKRLEKNGYF